MESGVDRIPRRGVDRAPDPPRIEDLILLRREGTAGAVAAKVGIRSGAEGAPEVDPAPALVLALLLGDVVAPEADLN